MGGNAALGNGPQANIASRALRTFVKNSCPSIKYKSLLLPPNGSIHKANRHFQEMLRVEDQLVVALAQERIFLCEWAENHFRPIASEKQRRKGEVLEVPEFALHILRCTFKSLSTKIKQAASKDEDSEILIKAWYSDHINWATTWAIMGQSCGPRAKEQPLALTAHGEPRQPERAAAANKGKRGKGKDGGKGIGEQPNKAPRLEQGDTNGTPSFNELASSRMVGQEIISKMYDLYPSETRAFWKENCRNCFAAGKGRMSHSFYDCQKMGNPGVLRCLKCRAGNHWISECTA